MIRKRAVVISLVLLYSNLSRAEDALGTLTAATQAERNSVVQVTAADKDESLGTAGSSADAPPADAVAELAGASSTAPVSEPSRSQMSSAPAAAASVADEALTLESDVKTVLEKLSDEQKGLALGHLLQQKMEAEAETVVEALVKVKEFRQQQILSLRSSIAQYGASIHREAALTAIETAIGNRLSQLHNAASGATGDALQEIQAQIDNLREAAKGLADNKAVIAQHFSEAEAEMNALAGGFFNDSPAAKRKIVEGAATAGIAAGAYLLYLAGRSVASLVRG